MKKLLSLALLSGFLLTISGCVVDEVAVSSRPSYRPGYYSDRRTTHYDSRPVYRETRPVYRSDYRGYSDDGYYGRRDVRVYNAPRPRQSDVRVVF